MEKRREQRSKKPAGGAWGQGAKWPQYNVILGCPGETAWSKIHGINQLNGTVPLRTLSSVGNKWLIRLKYLNRKKGRTADPLQGGRPSRMLKGDIISTKQNLLTPGDTK